MTVCDPAMYKPEDCPSEFRRTDEQVQALGRTHANSGWGPNPWPVWGERQCKLYTDAFHAELALPTEQRTPTLGQKLWSLCRLFTNRGVA